MGDTTSPPTMLPSPSSLAKGKKPSFARDDRLARDGARSMTGPFRPPALLLHAAPAAASSSIVGAVGRPAPPTLATKDGCDKTKTKEEETVADSVAIGNWQYTQQSNRSQGGGVLDGDNYDDDDDDGQQRR